MSEASFIRVWVALEILASRRALLSLLCFASFRSADLAVLLCSFTFVFMMALVLYGNLPEYTNRNT